MDVLWFLTWFVIITLTGWAAFPLAYRFFSHLPDRGYALSRALGWLVWGFLFWLLGSLGLLQNNLGGEIFAFALLALISAVCIWGPRRGELWAWVKDHRGYILSAEAVFLVAFAALAFVRAANPEIDGTEKPMELAFLNAILKSPTLPPHDPWLSGYSISYYYFGYILVSMIIRLSGVVTGVGFNLAVSLVFGLTAIGAYGILFNLLALRRPRGQETGKGPLGLPVFGPIFVLVMGNLVGILAMLHDKGIFWTQTNGAWQSGFWKWLGIQDLVNAPTEPLSWMPHFINPWWRASRVLQDFYLNGTSAQDVIDEIPAFSFILSDLHPHVLTLPFVMLMVGLALNIWLSARETGFSLFGIRIPFGRAGFVLAVVLLGALGFLNTWDFPIYIALTAGAFTLGRAQEEGWHWSLVGDFLGLALVLGIAGGILYLPFYIGFSSQAGGVLPSMIFFTRGTQFWVMFGTLLIPILAFLGYRLVRPKAGRPDFLTGILISTGLVVVLWLAMYGLGIIASRLPTLGSIFMGNLRASNMTIGEVISASLFGFVGADGVALPGRLSAPGAWISLTAILGLTLAAVIGLKLKPSGLPDEESALAQSNGQSENSASSRPDGFWLLLVLVGGLLVLTPEFFYLRDDFGARMNTIFKFYFAVWSLWGLSAAYALSVLLLELDRVWGLVWRVAALALLGIGLTYAGWGVWIKTNGFRPGDGLTLDGNQYLQKYAADDVAAVAWLDQQPPGVIAESKGEQYHSETSRAATLSGYSTVIGWAGHEGEWGRDGAMLAGRVNDLQTLYTTNDWKVAQEIIQKYGIRYIYVSPVERQAYGQVVETKFQRNLPAPHQEGNVTIYVVPQSSPLVDRSPWNGGVTR
jgi:YYY domain-containing protein